MILGSQKYQNTSRTITGLLNDVYTSDVLLFCDTSSGAVALNLLEIPADFWNTNYKLYVIDLSNNAQTNNITINAPVGYQVNNSSSFVISTNGGIALIRIVNNTDYSVETNYGAGGLAVLNEGILLTPNATSMDFIGSYVNATNVGSAVSVFIQPSVISITYAQLQTAITNSTLIAGQMYSVSNAIFIQTTNETTAVYLVATSTNTISGSGQGYFLNADYQGTGNYSGVSGFVAQLGIWKGSLTPVIGNVVIWNNFHYVNISGNNTQPDLNPTDWTQLTKSNTNGYIVEICDIEYSVNTNSILQRNDLRENIVQNNIATYLTLGVECFQYFQWGSNNCKSNNVTSEGAIKNSNNLGSVSSNVVCSGGLLKIQSGSSTQGVSAVILSNNIQSGSKLTINDDVLSPTIAYNDFSEYSLVTISKLADPPIEGTIASNKFSQCTINLAPCSITSTIYTNLFKGISGTLINDFGSFSFNEIYTDLNYTFNIQNTGDAINQAIFNNNQIYNSDIEVTNLGTIKENEIKSCVITIAINPVSISLRQNLFKNFTIQLGTNNCTIAENQFYNGQITAIDLNTSNLRNIIGELNVTTLGNFTYDIAEGTINSNFTTTGVNINVSDPLIYDLATQTLTIPSELEFVCGIITLVNGTAPIVINKIVGGLNAQNGAMKFINSTGFNVDFVATLVGLAVGNEIISNLAPTTYTIVDRTNGTDSIYVRRLGAFCGVEQVYIYV